MGIDQGLDVTSVFQGVTTPLRELLDEIHQRGWDVSKIDIKDGQWAATCKNPSGQQVEKTGPTQETAVSHCLVAIMRLETMRFPNRTAAWENTWEDKLAEIAQAYADAPTYDPKAASAWKELAEDSVSRAKTIADQIRVEFTADPYPYKDVNEMSDDIRNNQKVQVSKANLSHPLWSNEQALAYRLVHDVLGHAQVGGDWGWHGENGATAAHMPLLSPQAQRALFTEAIGQTAHNHFYRQLGPQKVVFLDDHLQAAQDSENAAGHGGVHPSQTLVPTGIPTIEPEEKISSVQGQVDPNHGWETGIEPLPDNAYLWQKEESGKDPLDFQGLRDQAHQIDSGWFNLHHHDGGPDFDSQRQAVVNAFRSVLLRPRQDPRWSATHYQHIQGLPATVSDPLRYADVLDVQREAHNQARGLPKGIHNQLWAAESKALKQWIKGMNPKLDDAQVAEQARRELFHMMAEEEERVTADDTGGDLSPMEIAEAVNKALKKRLTVITKSNIDQKFDFGNERLFHEAFNAPDPGVYGSYLNSHLRPISGVSLNADALLAAARNDVAHHGGKGHHFRAEIMDLIPGVGPAEISHAWSLLQPHTSQLGIINPSIAEALGHAPEEPPRRDYFKMERQLAAGRDAAGYTHVPLGQFSKGLYDLKSYGHGVHQDERPFAINPIPYDQVDWRKFPNQPTATWDKPYWWESTQPQRDEVGKQWDRMVAIQHPSDAIPFRTAATTRVPWVIHHDTGEILDGDPNLSLMQHAKNSLGLSTEQIWALDPEAGKR